MLRIRKFLAGAQSNSRFCTNGTAKNAFLRIETELDPHSLKHAPLILQGKARFCDAYFVQNATAIR